MRAIYFRHYAPRCIELPICGSGTPGEIDSWADMRGDTGSRSRTIDIDEERLADTARPAYT